MTSAITSTLTEATATATDIAAAVRKGRVSAQEIVEATLDRIERLDGILNAFTHVEIKRARDTASRIDARIGAGENPGPLAGVPFAVKNLFDIEGVTTLAGSKINTARPPAAADAPLIEKLTAAGAILMGGLNMGEYAYDFTGENCHYGPSRNPHDPNRMSGGSSGGSGAATASGMVAFTLGSDTNGSIRVPSSFCGLFGLKPTFGRLSRSGTFPFCASLDHVGPLARSTADLALVYDAAQGHDPRDPVSCDRPPEPAAPAVAHPREDLRVSVASGYFRTLARPEVQAAIERVAKTLDTKQTVEIPMVEQARSAAYVITATEASALHRNRLRERPMDFDPDVRDRLFAGALAPAQWYTQAQRLRSLYRQAFLKLFEDADIIIAPSTPTIAPAIGQQTFVLNGKEVPVRANIGIFTQPFSFIGLPVVAVPIGCVSDMPVGVQIIAAPWREEDALSIAAILERDGIARSRIAEPEAFDA